MKTVAFLLTIVTALLCCSCAQVSTVETVEPVERPAVVEVEPEPTPTPTPTPEPAPTAVDDVRLTMSAPSYPVGTDEVGYAVFNDSGDKLYITYIPRLERLGTAWEPVAFSEGTGFCGVSDPLHEGRTDGAVFLSWFDDLGPGTYRLSFDVMTEEGERPVSDVFELVEGEDSPLYVVSEGRRVVPRLEYAYSREWTEAGWLYADGLSWSAELPQVYMELPVVSLADGFDVQYGEGVAFDRLSVYDADFEQLHSNAELSYLNDLPDGEYYIGIYVSKDGEYIESEGEWEYTGWVGAYRLKAG